MDFSASIINSIKSVQPMQLFGKVVAVKGLMIACTGLKTVAAIGSTCEIETRDGNRILAEVVGIEKDASMLMPYEHVEGIGVGAKVYVRQLNNSVSPSLSWKGRVINALGEPIDSKGPLECGDQAYKLLNNPPPAHQRKRVNQRIELGITAMNLFTPCCKGQRMGLFAGSGVGKSVLVSMLAKCSSAEIKVVGLIGERGREVQEFIQDYLGEEGLANTVLVVATADESALMRKRAAYTTMAVAEFFRDQGLQVMCLMDSVTRFAMAQREIGLSLGEPPTAKGYTPTVFAELPKLLERAGPGSGDGDITGMFTVLVEGDDHNEPISDAVRAILDGHVVLDREIASRGRFPAIDVLKSLSRTSQVCVQEEEAKFTKMAREFLSTYYDMEELIRIGAYKVGSDPKVDAAIHYTKPIETLLTQAPNAVSTIEKDLAALKNILNSATAGQ